MGISGYPPKTPPQEIAGLLLGFINHHSPLISPFFGGPYFLWAGRALGGVNPDIPNEHRDFFRLLGGSAQDLQVVRIPPFLNH